MSLLKIRKTKTDLFVAQKLNSAAAQTIADLKRDLELSVKYGVDLLDALDVERGVAAELQRSNLGLSERIQMQDECIKNQVAQIDFIKRGEADAHQRIDYLIDLIFKLSEGHLERIDKRGRSRCPKCNSNWPCTVEKLISGLAE